MVLLWLSLSLRIFSGSPLLLVSVVARRSRSLGDSNLLCEHIFALALEIRTSNLLLHSRQVFDQVGGPFHCP